MKWPWTRSTPKRPEAFPDALPADVVRDYERSRTIRNKEHICHAPFNNLYFNTEGHVAVCWLTFNDPVIYSEDRTLWEIWQDTKFKSLRDHVAHNDLHYGCRTCEKNLLNGNFVNVLAKAYDSDVPLGDYPSIIEFELDNTCNLGCTMCNGMLSSTIRRDREGLPPLKSPYGQKFIDELRDFIPHLSEARFNGGEPFLIKTYWPIWEMILEIKPEIKVTIATNGTVLTSKVKDFMRRGNVHLNISIDGFTAETYESIRIGGNFKRLMKNLDWFAEFCNANDRTLCIMINPMRQNWWEMPLFLNWVNQRNVHLWFNTIQRPEDQAIWNLPAATLQEIHETLAAAEIAPRPSGTDAGRYDYNVKTFNNLVHQQIKDWWHEAQEREAKGEEIHDVPSIRDFLSDLLPRLDDPEAFRSLWEGLSDEQRARVLRSSVDVDMAVIAEQVNSRSEDELIVAIDQLA